MNCVEEKPFCTAGGPQKIHVLLCNSIFNQMKLILQDHFGTPINFLDNTDNQRGGNLYGSIKSNHLIHVFMC